MVLHGTCTLYKSVNVVNCQEDAFGRELNRANCERDQFHVTAVSGIQHLMRVAGAVFTLYTSSTSTRHLTFLSRHFSYRAIMIKVSGRLMCCINASDLDHFIQIWSMKKNEDAAAKKKPKTSAAQIRVQKGTIPHSPHENGIY